MKRILPILFIIVSLTSCMNALDALDGDDLLAPALTISEPARGEQPMDVVFRAKLNGGIKSNYQCGFYISRNKDFSNAEKVKVSDVDTKAGTFSYVKTFPSYDETWYVKAYCSNGRIELKSISVTYTHKRIAVTGVSLSSTSHTLTVGSTITLTATVSPSNAGDKSVVWSSNNSSVATVDQSGKITAIKAGTATITVKTNDGGYTATCTVTVQGSSTGNYENGYEYVDLGLSVKWATCNVGATTPEGYGSYFAWGETVGAPYITGKTSGYTKSFDWSTYKYCKGSYTTMTKYCNNSSYGYNGFTDNKTTLELSDDAARANWGGRWRMPTKSEYDELSNSSNCTWTWTILNGVNGYKVVSKKPGYEGRFIFLPAAGYRRNTNLNSSGSYGYYWSSSLGTGSPSYAWLLYFGSGGHGTYGSSRDSGQSVRPVCL